MSPAPDDASAGSGLRLIQAAAGGPRAMADGGLAGRLGRALAAAGIAPEALEANIRSTPDAIDVWLVHDPHRDVTIEQLAMITSVLRAGETSGRAIRVGVV